MAAIALMAALPACLEFQENPLDQSNGGLLGNILINQALIDAAGSGGGSGGSSTIAKFVAVGNTGTGYTSLDGTTWDNLTIVNDTNVIFNKVIWTGTRWVAVGNSTSTTAEVIYHSTDGFTWTAAIITTPCSGGSRTLRDVVLGGGNRLVAVGAAGTTNSCVLNSVDDGVTWNLGPSPAGAIPYSRIATDGTNFLASVQTLSGGGPTMYMSDGTIVFTTTGAVPNVTAGPAGSTTGDLFNIGSHILWVGNNNASPSRADSSFTADLGASWGPDTLPIFDDTTANFPRALAVNGTRVVAVGDACYADYSDDNGLNWNVNGTIAGCTSTLFVDVVYDSTTSSFIATGSAPGPSEFWQSTDNGATWTMIVGGLTNTVVRSLAVR